MKIHRAKKSMGQNFLKSEAALRMMCEADHINNTDTVLEIGPGKGALTRKILKCAGNVIAVEKDRDLIALLKEMFAEEILARKFILIEGDILDFDPSQHGLKEGEYKITANIPYNITGAILKKFLSEELKPSSMTLLVQKEVAERIVARNHKESILSLSVKAYGTPRYVMKVGKRFFSPSPKVDSAIIVITDISDKNFKSKDEENLFFAIIKAGFAHKRKVLRKNLEDTASTQVIDALFAELDMSPNTRAEDVSFPLWLETTHYLADKQ